MILGNEDPPPDQESDVRQNSCRKKSLTTTIVIVLSGCLTVSFLCAQLERLLPKMAAPRHAGVASVLELHGSAFPDRFRVLLDGSEVANTGNVQTPVTVTSHLPLNAATRLLKNGTAQFPEFGDIHTTKDKVTITGAPDSLGVADSEGRVVIEFPEWRSFREPGRAYEVQAETESGWQDIWANLSGTATFIESNILNVRILELESVACKIRPSSQQLKGLAIDNRGADKPSIVTVGGQPLLPGDNLLPAGGQSGTYAHVPIGYSRQAREVTVDSQSLGLVEAGKSYLVDPTGKRRYRIATVYYGNAAISSGATERQRSSFADRYIHELHDHVDVWFESAPSSIRVPAVFGGGSQNVLSGN